MTISSMQDPIENLQTALSAIRKTQSKIYICKKENRWIVSPKKPKQPIYLFFKDLNDEFANIFFGWNPFHHKPLSERVKQIKSLEEDLNYLNFKYLNKIRLGKKTVLSASKKEKIQQTIETGLTVIRRLQNFTNLLEKLIKPEPDSYVKDIKHFSSSFLDNEYILPFRIFAYQFTLALAEIAPKSDLFQVDFCGLSLSTLEKIETCLAHEAKINHLIKQAFHPNLIRQAIIDFYVCLKTEISKQGDEAIFSSEWLPFFLKLEKYDGPTGVIPYIDSERPLTQFFNTHFPLLKPLQAILGEYDFEPSKEKVAFDYSQLTTPELREQIGKHIIQNTICCLKINMDQLDVLFENEGKELAALIKRLDLIALNPHPLRFKHYWNLSHLLEKFPSTIVVIWKLTEWDVAFASSAFNSLTASEKEMIYQHFGRLYFPDVTAANLNHCSRLGIKGIQMLPLAFPNVKSLDLSYLHLVAWTSPEPVARFRQLEQLALRGNHPLLISFILGLTHFVQYLDLSDTKVLEKDIVHWAQSGKLHELKYLNLIGCPSLSSFQQTLAALASLPKIRSFRLPKSWPLRERVTIPSAFLEKGKKASKDALLELSILRSSFLSSSELGLEKIFPLSFPVALNRRWHVAWSCNPTNLFNWLTLRRAGVKTGITFKGGEINTSNLSMLNDEDLIFLLNRFQPCKQTYPYFTPLTIRLNHCTSLTNQSIAAILTLPHVAIELLDLTNCHQITDEAFQQLLITEEAFQKLMQEPKKALYTLSERQQALKNLTMIKTLNIKGTGISSHLCRQLDSKYPHMQVSSNSYLELYQFFSKRPCPDMKVIWKNKEGAIIANIEAHAAIVCRIWQGMQLLSLNSLLQVEVNDSEDQMSEAEFNQLVEYAYTDSIKYLNFQTALRFALHGKQWKCQNLAHYCENWVKFQITIENVWTVYELAKQHQHSFLLCCARQFIESFLHPDNPPFEDGNLLQFSSLSREKQIIIEQMIKEPFSENKEPLQRNSFEMKMPFPDLVLQLGVKQFSVHSSLFALKSLYFQGLLNGFKESKQKILVIPNDVVPQSIMEMVIGYIQGIKIENYDVNISLDLLVAAEYFLITDLKQFCLVNIKSRMSLENFYPIFNYVTKYNWTFLISFCLDYLFNHLFVDKNLRADLAVEILSYAKENKRNDIWEECLDKINEGLSKHPLTENYMQLFEVLDEFNLIDLGKIYVHRFLKEFCHAYKTFMQEYAKPLSLQPILDLNEIQGINESFIRILSYLLSGQLIKLDEKIFKKYSERLKKYLKPLGNGIYQIKARNLEGLKPFLLSSEEKPH